MSEQTRQPGQALPRRQFLRDAAAGVVAFVAIGCTSSKKKSMVPRSTTTTTVGTSTTTTLPFEPGFGGRIDAGTFESVRAAITNKNAPHYVPEARAYVSAFPSELLERAHAVYPAATL